MDNKSNVLYKNKELSVVRNEPRKLTLSESGYMDPPTRDGDTLITPDRFCCANCVRYQQAKRECYIVAGGDIDPRGCCNFFATEMTIHDSEPEAGLQLPVHFQTHDIVIAQGCVGSLEAHAIVNGLPNIVVNKKMLLESFEKLNFGLSQKSRKSRDYSSGSSEHYESLIVQDEAKRRRKRGIKSVQSCIII